MKNNKGFTLIELIGIIIILGVVVALGVPSLIRTLKNNENKEYETFEKNLFLATETYIQQNINSFPELAREGGVAIVDIETLVNSGLVKSNIVNPKTNEKVNFKDFIKATKKNFQYNYEYVKEPTPEVVGEFAHTTEVQSFTPAKKGYYKLEVWGAQGGSVVVDDETYEGGYGAYASGMIQLEAGKPIYIFIGGTGISSEEQNEVDIPGGYNGGGYAYAPIEPELVSSGGGATHISYFEFSLDDLGDAILDESEVEGYKDNLIILASGGGGAFKGLTHPGISSHGGHGGGYNGTSPLEDNVQCNSSMGFIDPETLDQIFDTNNKMNSYCILDDDTILENTDYKNLFNNDPTLKTIAFDKLLETLATETGHFGHGGYFIPDLYLALPTGQMLGDLLKEVGASGGGSGYYGGGLGYRTGGNGGFSYVGNSALQNKRMVCYKCKENSKELTFATTEVSTDPISETAKKGNGYARITYLGF